MPRTDYFYTPSVPIAVVFAVLFALATIAHVTQAFRFKTLFMLTLLAGVAMEVIGYVTRIVSIGVPDSLPSVIISQVALIVAPAFLAGQDYMIIGRVIAYVGAEYSVVDHDWITKIFVGADFFTILVQACGGAMLASGQGNVPRMQLAKDILLIGLTAQIISFVVFLVIAISFDVRTSRAPALEEFHEEMRRLRKLWIAFYLSAFLITGRSIYRTAEFGQVNFSAGEAGPTGYLLVHEWPFYVLDAIPTLIAVLIFLFYHPGHYLPARKGLRIDGTHEDQTLRGPREKISGESQVALHSV